MPPPPPFSVTASRPDAATVALHVVGDLDLATVPALRERYDRELADAGAERVVLDLRRTSFVDSTAIAGLLDLHAREPELVLLAPSAAVRRVLGLLALEGHFTIDDG